MGNLVDKEEEPLPRHDEIPEKAQIAKRQIEIYYRDFVARFEARNRVNARIDYGAVVGKYDENTRLKLRRQQFLRELEYIRRRTKPLHIVDFDIIRKIGQGSYGQVFLVRLKSTGKIFAMKKLSKEDMIKKRQVSHVWLERFVLATVGEHPHVVKMYFSFQDFEYLYFIMEYLPGGDLLNMLIRYSHLSENWARFYIAELIVAIDALHRTGIIHRDIKPDNVLFSKSGHVVLSDFGLCKFVLGDLQSNPVGPANAPNFIENVKRGEFDLTLQERKAAWKAIARNRVFSAVGTPSYIAPEVLNDTYYSETCDWWSVGAILYEMLIGVPPFLGDTPENTIEMIRNWRDFLDFPRHWPKSRLSPEALDLMGRLLCDSSCRLGSNGLSEFRDHPFFNGVDWNNLSMQKAPFVPELKHEVDTRYFDDEILDPPPFMTSNANTSSTSSNATGSGSVDTAKSKTSTSTTIGTRKSSSSRRQSRPTRLGDLDFLGFTYMPMQPSDHRSWNNEVYNMSGRGSAGSASSAPYRSSSQKMPPRVRSTINLNEAANSAPDRHQGFPKRSHSVGASTARRNNNTTQRTSSSHRNAPPLPPQRASSSRERTRPGYDTATVHGSGGMSPLSERISIDSKSPQIRPNTGHGRMEKSTSENNYMGERKHTGPFITAEQIQLDAGNRQRQSQRQEDSNGEDFIVQGLGAIEVTESYPVDDELPRTTTMRIISNVEDDRGVRNLGEKRDDAEGQESETILGASETEEKQQPQDVIPTMRTRNYRGDNEGSLGAENVPMAASASDVDSADVMQRLEWQPSLAPTSSGRPHKKSLLPVSLTTPQLQPQSQPLDAVALEVRDIAVPSTEDVVSFVADAVEELEDAAAVLDVDKTTPAIAKDIDTVIRDAAMDLNGIALELHRNLSESNSENSRRGGTS